MTGKNIISNLKPLYILIIIIVLSLSAAAVIYISPVFLGNSETDKQQYTTSFSNITVQDAYHLLNNTTQNINLIDNPRGCDCRYDSEHIGLENKFEAIKITDYKSLPHGIITLYNTTNITIIYDDYGDGHAYMDCLKLMGHVYGKVYYLEGGMAAWKAKGYPIIKP